MECAEKSGGVKMLKTLWLLMLLQIVSFCEPFENNSEPLTASELDGISVSLDFAELLEPGWTAKEQTVVDFISELLCPEESNYRFYHVLVDHSLRTRIADEILKRLGACLSAGILTTQ